MSGNTLIKILGRRCREYNGVKDALGLYLSNITRYERAQTSTDNYMLVFYYFSFQRYLNINYNVNI